MATDDYTAFLATKAVRAPKRGTTQRVRLAEHLFPYQAECVRFGLRGDSTFSRQGLPEYFLVFRKWAREGEEAAPVTHTPETFPLTQWQEWASPVWMDTRETDVLNVAAARDPRDEKHICPLPLDLTTRAVLLWSNPGDVVLSPFMGIGSEGVVSLRQGRRFIGVELKDSYYRQAVRALEAEDAQHDLFRSNAQEG